MNIDFAERHTLAQPIFRGLVGVFGSQWFMRPA
jgi:hypothetical protein